MLEIHLAAETQPEIQVGDAWFSLESLNDVPAYEILEFSRRTYGDLWRKRFEEDLVELLIRMGHPPRDTVTLVVVTLDASEKRILKDAPMTEANRRAIRNAAQAGESDGDSTRRETPGMSSLDGEKK